MKQFILMFVVLLSTPVFASSPFDVTLTYDVEKGILHVSAKHPSDRTDHHYINRVKIFKNDALVDSQKYFWQKLPKGLEADYSLTAEVGDKISLEITCIEGGKAAAETTVVDISK